MGRPLRTIQSLHPYHLVTRTNNRAFRFNKKKATRIFFKTLAQAAEKYEVSVSHVVLMTNHYHLLVKTRHDNIHRFMQYLNARTAFRFNRTTGRSGHLWADRYCSTIVADDQHYVNTVRYIYRNPLRAAMVHTLEHHQESSFIAWAFGKKIEVILDPDLVIIYPDDSKRKIAWKLMALVMDKGQAFPSDSYMRAALSKTFYGPEGFKESVLQNLNNASHPVRG